MKVEIATPEKIIFQGESSDILLKAEMGQLNILEGHANLITLLEAGPVHLRDGTSSTRFAVGKGLLKVEDGMVSLLCEKAEECDQDLYR